MNPIRSLFLLPPLLGCVVLGQDVPPMATPPTNVARPSLGPTLQPGGPGGLRPATGLAGRPRMVTNTPPTGVPPQSTGSGPGRLGGPNRPGAPGVAGNPTDAGANPAGAPGNGAAGTPGASADDPNGEGSDIIEFKKLPLDAFLDEYAEVAKKAVLRGQGLPAPEINLKLAMTLSNDELLQIYDTVLALNGVTIVPTSDRVVLAVPTAQAAQEGEPFSTLTNSAAYPEASVYVTHIVQVKHMPVEEAADLCRQFAKNQNGIIGLPSAKTLIIRDYAINIKRMLEMLAKVDVVAEQTYELEVIPIKYGRVEDIYATMSSVIGGGGGGAGFGGVGGVGRVGGTGGLGGAGGGFNRSGVGGTGGFGGSRVGGVGSSYGTGAYGGSGFGGGAGYSGYSVDGPTPIGTLDSSGVTPMQAVPAVRTTPGATTGAGGTFGSRYNSANRNGGKQGDVEPLVGEAQITPDLRGNSLIVYANKKDMATIKKVLSKVDTLLPQVLIEGVIMSVDRSKGLEWSSGFAQSPKQFSSKVTGGGAINDATSAINFLKGVSTNAVLSTTGFGYAAQLGKNWNALVNAAANDSRTEIIQRPRIITSHATQAEFFVGSSIPYRQGGYNYGGSESYTYASLPVGIRLSVQPYITPDGLVVMQVNQSIESVSEKGNTSSGIPPTTSQKSANSVVSVLSGDAILLGGYIENQKDRGTVGVPFLKDIPVLGYLFKSDNRSDSKSELMVLIRPTILTSPREAAKLAERQQHESGDIRELEINFEAQEKASKERAEKLDRKGSWKK